MNLEVYLVIYQKIPSKDIGNINIIQNLTQCYMYVTLILGQHQLQSDDLSCSYESRIKSNLLSISPINRGYLNYKLNA